MFSNDCNNCKTFEDSQINGAKAKSRIVGIIDMYNVLKSKGSYP